MRALRKRKTSEISSASAKKFSPCQPQHHPAEEVIMSCPLVIIVLMVVVVRMVSLAMMIL